MTESAPNRGNPLATDLQLFRMYMNALTPVLADNEIGNALDELGLSAAFVRMRMVSQARHVFATAVPQEFEAYERVLAGEAAVGRISSSQITHGSRREVSGNVLWIPLIVIGGIMVVIGATVTEVWPLILAGSCCLVIAAVISVVPPLSRLFRQLTGEPVSGVTSLMIPRERLMRALTNTELLAQVRTFINLVRKDRFGLAYSVTGSPGLSEVYDSINRVPTAVAAQLEGLLERFDGGSVGVAGPRGSGKSTLVRGYCDDTDLAELDDKKRNADSSPTPAPSPYFSRYDLRCMVAAPVDYIARDFVLHLFAVFCRAVIARDQKELGEYRLGAGRFWLARTSLACLQMLLRVIIFGAAAVALLHWKEAIAHKISFATGDIVYLAFSLLCLGAISIARVLGRFIRSMEPNIHVSDLREQIVLAQNHLSRVRYLQTYTSGWSGTLSLGAGRIGGERSRNVAKSEQALSYPEIVNEFRNFARSVATGVHRNGDRVFIGVDELDKIGSPQQVERFLNEIKGIFGIPHLYFLVSVSDDALTAFERRGLPLRDAFDSSFDEIIHVGSLSYAESRRLLYRRVVGLTEPYVALCHCLAGGLARDVIRAARQVVQTATSLMIVAPPEQARYTEDGTEVWDLPYPDEPEQPDDAPTLGAITTRLVHDELRRKARAISHVLKRIESAEPIGLQELLHDLIRPHTLEGQAIAIVDLLAESSQNDSSEVAILRFDLTAYAYYCATLQEVFTDDLTSEQMAGATGERFKHGNFDTLAFARNAFAIDTSLAWRSISQFRKAWSLEIREPGLSTGYSAG